MTNTVHIQAHTRSTRHRREIIASRICGCFYCLEIFSPAAIREWIDEEHGLGQTALCPYCGIDSVIGSASGYTITTSLLRRMRDHWFATD